GHVVKLKRNARLFAAAVTTVLIMLMTCSGCENAPMDESETLVYELEPSQETAELMRGLAVVESAIDFDRDGDKEKLVVQMTEGRQFEETEPGAIMGEVMEGTFRLVLVDANGTELHQLDLNPSFGGGTLLFEQ